MFQIIYTNGYIRDNMNSIAISLSIKNLNILLQNINKISLLKYFINLNKILTFSSLVRFWISLHFFGNFYVRKLQKLKFFFCGHYFSDMFTSGFQMLSGVWISLQNVQHAFWLRYITMCSASFSDAFFIWRTVVPCTFESSYLEMKSLLRHHSFFCVTSAV